MTRPDRALQQAFEQLARGDLNALETIWDAHSTPLHNYALAITRSQDEADDVLGEVFERLARGGRKLRKIRRPTAYLFTMVRNAALSRAKRLGARAASEIDERHIAANPATEDIAVRQAVLDLPPDQREAVVLHVFAGLTFAEIGRVTRASPNTAAGRYRYALQKLRMALGGTDDE